MKDQEMEKQEYSSSDRLTEMFYLLMRDAVSFGEMESIVSEVEIGVPETVDKIVYSNGHLAKYAKELSDRIRGVIDFHVVVAYRYGTNEHVFPIGVFSNKKLAANAAAEHSDYRGGKYKYKIYKVNLDLWEDNSGPKKPIEISGIFGE